jgi:hypothetical protein
MNSGCRFLKILSFASSLLVTSALPMTAEAQCNGYYCQGVIQSMTVADTAVYIQLVGGLSGLTNCTPYSQSYVTLPRDNPVFKDYYATLLAAYLAKQSVTLRPLDSSANCSLAYIALP